MVVSIIDNWHDALNEHKHYVDGVVRNALQIPADKKGYVSNILLRKFIQDNKDDIAIGKPAKLEELIKIFKRIINGLPEADVKLIHKESKRIFNYVRFTKKSGEWNAYTLLEKSKYHICPYCNQSFAFTVVTKHKSFRPTLDHFYSKDLYPFLAISLNNLVPSCYTCNSNLKGASDFFEHRHLHPMHDKEDVCFRLVGRTGGMDFIDAKHDIKKWRALYKLESYSSVELDEPSNNSIKTFLLNDRFELNLAYLKDYIYRLQFYDNATKELYRDLLSKMPEESVILGFDKLNYKNQILGKVMHDLYNQIKAAS